MRRVRISGSGNYSEAERQEIAEIYVAFGKKPYGVAFFDALRGRFPGIADTTVPDWLAKDRHQFNDQVRAAEEAIKLRRSVGSEAALRKLIQDAQAFYALQKKMYDEFVADSNSPACKKCNRPTGMQALTLAAGLIPSLQKSGEYEDWLIAELKKHEAGKAEKREAQAVEQFVRGLVAVATAAERDILRGLRARMAGGRGKVK